MMLGLACWLPSVRSSAASSMRPCACLPWVFDSDRFPFLEGRTKDSDWRVDVARPLPIDNRTVLLLQQHQGRTLSYRALDVEQIGYVYEGLLERTVARTARVTVGLSAGKGANPPHRKRLRASEHDPNHRHSEQEKSSAHAAKTMRIL